MEKRNPKELLEEMGILFDAHSFVYSAGAENNITAVELMIEAGMNVNTQYGEFTALIEACNSGNMNIVKLLIEKGADVNFQRSHGVTPLMCAVEHNLVNVVKELLKSNPDLELQTNDQLTALGWAESKNRNEIAELLKQAGAKEPPKATSNKSVTRSKGNTKTLIQGGIGFVVLMVLLGVCMKYTGGPSPSSSNPYIAKDYNCTYCGKKYTGTGYYHILDDCVKRETEHGLDPGFAEMCSKKCCMESWNLSH